MKTQKPTERFTDTVNDYLKYRPSYPHEVLQFLIDECHLTKEKIIADIGSGTGLLSKLFLDTGNTVYGVEPNQAMREAAEHYLKNYPNFHSISATAEATTLKDNSVDIITVGTAFHWFDAIKTKQEFKRILKNKGWVLLVWNVRNTESLLVNDYEKLLLKFATDYQSSSAKKFEKTVTQEFFTPNPMHTRTIPNVQYFDWIGFKGRLLSASYSLRPGDENFEDMINELRIIFDRYQHNGSVEFLYHTKLYYGQLHG